MEEGRWVTMNGTHVFVKNGQNPMDAFIKTKNQDHLMKIDPNKKIYRAYNEDFESKDFNKTGAFYDDDKDLVLDTYGDNLDTKGFSSDAKIYQNEKSSWDFVHKNNLLDQKCEALKGIKSQFYPVENDKGLTTLRELFKDIKSKGYGDYDEFTGVYNYTDMGLYATQIVAKYELEKRGYDGVHWLDEEDGDPKQYQIWNKKVLK